MLLKISRSKCFHFLVMLAFFVCTAFGQKAEPQARKFDEFYFGFGNDYPSYYYSTDYYKAEQEDFKARLAFYAKQLRLEKIQPYVIAYSPRVMKSGFSYRPVAETRLREVYSELTNLGFENGSIKTVDGGFREKATTELWIVPRGAKPPPPAPTIEPKDVVYCSKVYLVGSLFHPKPTEPIEISARLATDISNINPVFNWQTSGGKIIAGQGTQTIRAEPSVSSKMIVAKVSVEGFSLECPAQDLSDTETITVNVPHFKIDEFGEMPSGATKARLDNVAVHSQVEPSLRIQVVVYEGRGDAKAVSERRKAFIKNYLVNTRGIDPGRVFFVEGGYRHNLETEIWLSVDNAGLPPLTPTIDKKYGGQKSSPPLKKS